MKKSDLFDPDEIQPWYLTASKLRGGNKYVNNIHKASEITNFIFDNKEVINKD